MPTDTIQWSAPEYKEKIHSNDWYWAVGLIALALVVIAVVLNNILFAILIVIAVFTLFLYAVRTPRTISFEINQRGISIDGKLHPYQSLESFWVQDIDDEPRLLLKSERTLSPLLTIPLSEEVDPQDVRDLLLDYLDEVEHPDSAAEQVMDYLGF